MGQLFGGGAELLWVALKAMLLYFTAVFAFRLGRRRTLAEMSPFDFVAAVAIGAIIGRVPNASTTSYLEGCVTLVTILSAHALITWLRFFPKLSPFFDHPPRLLMAAGRILYRELHKSGLTENDLQGILRRHGITDLDQVSFAIFEQRGRVSILRRDENVAIGAGNLVSKVVEQIKPGPGL